MSIMTRNCIRTLPHRGYGRAPIWISLLLAVGCGGSGGGAPGVPTFPPPAQLYYDDAGGIPDSVRLVVRGQRDWEDVWSRATSRRADPPPLPEVDFSQDMVLIAAAGQMATGDRIYIDDLSVRRQLTADDDPEDVLDIVVQTIKGCGRFAGETYPVEIVRVLRFDGPITWVEQSRTNPDC
jgi:hypothetical protein